MPQSQVYEGTPEQLTAWLGRVPSDKRYRIVEIEEPKEPAETHGHSVQVAPEGKVQSKQLHARGMLAGVLNTEDYLRRKHKETVEEDKPLR